MCIYILVTENDFIIIEKIILVNTYRYAKIKHEINYTLSL